MWPSQVFTWTLGTYILGSSCFLSCLCGLNYKILKLPILFDVTKHGLKTSASYPLHRWKNRVSGNIIRMAAALIATQVPASRSDVFSTNSPPTLLFFESCIQHALIVFTPLLPPPRSTLTSKLIPLCVLFDLFLTHQAQFVLPIRSWMCDLALEHGQPTRNYTLNEN